MMRRTIAFWEKLVIVESPNKVIKVEGLLSDPKVIPDWSFKQNHLKRMGTGAETVVAMATTGHFMALKEIKWAPRPLPPVTEAKSGSARETFPSNGTLADFSLEWQLLPGRRIQDTLDRYMRDKLNNVSEIILATDPDREGELIAVHTLQTIKRLYPKLKVPFSRAYMHSITEEGIQKAMRERLLNTCDYDLANAAETRHAMDRIFGFLGSSVVRAANSQMRSIGRVQTPALILIQEKESKIEAFLEKNKVTYLVEAMCTFPSPNGTSFSQVATVHPDNKGEVMNWSSEAEARRHLREWDLYSSRDFVVSQEPVITVSDVPPPQPFTMATVIAKANRQLKMSSEVVSSCLQDLFQLGHITYPRTDSTRIDESALNTIYNTIRSTFGKEMLYRLEDRTPAKNTASTDAEKKSSKKKKGLKEKQKKPTTPTSTAPGNVEDAHEAIRPTNIIADGESLSLTPQTRAVYDLVRKNTLAAFMIPMKSQKIAATVKFTGGGGKRLFVVLDGKRIQEPGWTRAFQRGEGSPLATAEDSDDLTEKEGAPTVRSLSQEEFDAIVKLKGTLRTCRRTDQFELRDATVRENRPMPPLPHSEGSLIEELKNNGVGRPSTYPMIVKTLVSRGYIQVNAKGRCETTPIGRLLVSTAKSTFPSIIDIGFTSAFEKELDRIAKPDSSNLPAMLRGAKLSHADYVLSMFFSTFLNYVTEATRVQRGRIVERSMRLKHETESANEDAEMFEEAVEDAKQKANMSVPELALLPKSKNNFTELQRGLVDFLRRHFPPVQLSASVNPAPGADTVSSRAEAETKHKGERRNSAYYS